MPSGPYPRPGDAPEQAVSPAPTDWAAAAMRQRLRARYAAERRFRRLGLGAVILSVGFLAVLLVAMLGQGVAGFRQTVVRTPIDFAAAGMPLTASQLRGRGADLALAGAGLEMLVERAAAAAFGPQPTVADNAWLTVRDRLKRDPALLGRRVEMWLPATSAIDLAWKSGHGAAAGRTHALDAAGRVATRFNLSFLTGADATDAARAGIWSAAKGSLMTLAVTLALAFPVAVLAALYLEEFATRNRWTDLIEVSINNLAAVPSIIFGLLGLAVFLGSLGLPRSAPLVGGLTLALMTMPVIVIAARNAIRGVPSSIRDGARGIGASPVQVVFHHVLPLALPGILTGTIIGMARALGETAPLLMIGMRAFIAAPPGDWTAPATALPVQIFLWSDAVDRGFVEKTSAAIIVLLVVLLAMNCTAIWLRNRFERRW